MPDPCWETKTASDLSNQYELIESLRGSRFAGGIGRHAQYGGAGCLGRLSQAGVLDGLSGPLALVATSGFSATANLLSAGELVADKLPFAPNRTAAGPLLGRALAGGLAGAALFSAQRRPAAVGALLGATAAVGAAYGAFALRRQAAGRMGGRDGFAALAEDAIVGAIGLTLVSRLRATN